MIKKIFIALVLLSLNFEAAAAMPPQPPTIETTTVIESKKEVITEEVTLNDKPVLQEILSDKELNRFGNMILSSSIELKDFSDREITVFAPIEPVFTHLPPETLAKLESNNRPHHFAALIGSLTIPGRLELTDLKGDYNVIKSSNGTRLEIRKIGRHDYYVNGRHVLSRQAAGKGLIYRIDGFVTDPEATLNQANPSYSNNIIRSEHGAPLPAPRY